MAAGKFWTAKAHHIIDSPETNGARTSGDLLSFALKTIRMWQERRVDPGNVTVGLSCEFYPVSKE